MVRILSALAILSLAASVHAEAHSSRLSADEAFIVDHDLTRYRIAHADLDEDGTDEALIYAEGADYCGSGGCTLFVLAPNGARYRVVTRMTVTSPPIRVLPQTHHGWHDLGVNVAGGGIRPGHDVRLRYDGSSYPANPTIPPAVRDARPDGNTVMRAIDHATLRQIHALIGHLDLTSFPNSVGPRRIAGKTSFADYGFTRVEERPDGAALSEADFGWQMAFRILGRQDDAIRLCFSDTAQNGGNYKARTALLVQMSGERWTAREVKGGFAGCRNDPPM